MKSYEPFALLFREQRFYLNAREIDRNLKTEVKTKLSRRFIPAISEQLILKFMPFFIPHLIFSVVEALVFEMKNHKVEKLILEARSKNNCLGRYYTSNI